MNDLQVFNNSNWSIRSIEIDDQPWFIAKDICDILELSNPKMVLGRLDENEKGVSSIYTLGGKQEVQIINEFGLYSLILGSRKQEAKEFKRWITHEVIPQIRKTGGYMMSKPVHEVVMRALGTFMTNLETQNKNLKYENEQLKAKVSRMMNQIHATYFDKFS